MRDDVVERLRRFERRDVALSERDVGQTELADARLAALHGALGQVETVEGRPRCLERQRDQAGAIASADLEHATPERRSHLETEQRGDRGDA